MKMDKYEEQFKAFLKENNIEHWRALGFEQCMKDLGFTMDCYHSFEKHYVAPANYNPKEKEFQDWILHRLQQSSLQVVGSYIYSRYRYLTHWCEGGYSEYEGMYFFERAFEILKECMDKPKDDRI